jgi:hypothetical protein
MALVVMLMNNPTQPFDLSGQHFPAEVVEVFCFIEKFQYPVQSKKDLKIQVHQCLIADQYAHQKQLTIGVLLTGLIEKDFPLKSKAQFRAKIESVLGHFTMPEVFQGDYQELSPRQNLSGGNTTDLLRKLANN